MRRREFLKSTLPAAALIQGGLCPFAAQAEATPRAEQEFARYDLAVLGGTLSGCFAAWRAARHGLNVVLVERRTFLGAEITATLRPWLKRDGLDALPRELRDLLLPEEEQAEVGVAFDPHGASSIFGDEVPLFMGTVKKQLMQVLLDHGVNILLGNGVWGTVADSQKNVATGVVVANKFGLHMVQARQILDAEHRPFASTHQAGAPASFSLELYGVNPVANAELLVPKSLDLWHDRIAMHPGKRMPGQCFLEFHFVPAQDDIEQESRERTEQICGYLIREAASFRKARLVQMAWETWSVPGDEPAARKTPYANVATLPRLTRQNLSCRDLLDAYHEAGDRVGNLPKRSSADVQPSLIDCHAGKIPLAACQLKRDDDRGLNRAIWRILIPVEQYLPARPPVDVLVAGGGTAGAMAAMAGLTEQAETVTVECLPELGGTSTLGRVTGYYWGYKDTRFHDQIEEAIKEQGRLAGRCARGVARMLHYRKQATRPGGTLLTGCIICGTVTDGRQVKAVVVEKAGQLFTLAGKVIIDATGDGDVAVFAGAEYELGNRRMQCTQNYSQWDVNPGVDSWKDSSTNRDYDILWNHVMDEWQRGYQLSHQQAQHYDFTPLLTVRESRRIAGDYTLTLKDVVLQKRQADAICRANSDYDPHHFGDTAFTRIGCLLPHQVSAVVEMPYRAILPRGVDNLLISAKAISQTHNALQFTRMSFDIMTLGYVTGRIAARVAKAGISTREFDVACLRPELMELKILATGPPTESAPNQKQDHLDTRLIEDLAVGKTDALLKVTMRSGRAIQPRLSKAYGSVRTEDEQLRLSKALAWFGDSTGNNLILREMKRLFEQEQAEGKLPWEYYRKDKGSLYWPINQDIALLGLSGDRAVLPEILALADALPLDNPPVRQETAYNRGRIDLCLVPYYNRVINICFVLERMPDATAVRSLNRLLDDRFIRGHVCTVPADAGKHIYGGILESRLAATLARCGARRGLEILVDYLQDIHPMLADYAMHQLQDVLGKDYQRDRRQWNAQIASLSFPLAPRPVARGVLEW